MKIEKLHGHRIILAQLLLLCLPACVAAGYILWHLNQYFTVLHNNWVIQALYFMAGLIAGNIFYNYRFRFLSTFLPLVFLFYIISFILDHIYTGEFSAFYAPAYFFIFSVLFITGIVIGWGFARFRFFTLITATLLLILQAVMVSKIIDINAQKLIIAFIPVLFFAIYIIYAGELVRNMNEDDPSFGWQITKRLAGFTALCGIILLFLVLFFKQDFKAIEKQFRSKGEQEKQGNSESLTKENKDGTISNQKSMGMSGGRTSTKRLVFIAKLDNYFPNTEIPNPLYFTYDYYTRFDTLTQTLETDHSMPSNDLFQPDPSKIPLYFTKTDSSVLLRAKSNISRRVVTTEVYKSLLSPDEFLAPSTAFFCQPIAIDKDYQQQFKSAYRAKMYVSDLNSAYFVYNPAGNQTLESFQQQRFDLLRKIDNRNNEDPEFLKYYTTFPSGEAFDSIRSLAQIITKNAIAPVDKIIAIRDYFLSKDENGQPLFKYTENPGIPGLPSASKLNYFLFDNRKGYCAYFAGATMFLLRSLGIPSRISTGFLTVNRADKNKGWYWFYEDQAHAWVQVFFPGYGWLDFDTTIPSTEQQQAPAPDGTPPITVQTAFFVANGKVTSIDTVKKRMTMQLTKLIYHDKPFDLKGPALVNMDISMATISKDTGQVALSALEKGMEVTALSFSEQFKNIIANASDSATDILKKIPDPAPIDEIRIMAKEKPNLQKQQAEKIKRPVSLWTLLKIFLLTLAWLLIILFSIPYLVYLFLRNRAIHSKSIRKKAYYSYTSSMFLLNQLGYCRGNASPLLFAKNTIDPQFHTDFSAFIQVYLKQKYASETLTPWEEKIIQLFYKPFEKAVHANTKWFSKFLNIYRTINFFTKPKI